MKFLIVLFYLFLSNISLLGEGFLAGTLVKTPTPTGYTKIEDLKEGDSVCSYNFENKVLSQNKISAVYKEPIDQGCTLYVNNDEKIELSIDKEPINNGLELDIIFLDNDDIKITSESKVDAHTYKITVENDHNFFITKHDILVHNFAPAIGLCFAFGSGGVTFLPGASLLATCAAAFYMGIKKLFGKKDNDKIPEFKPDSNEPKEQKDPENKDPKDNKNNNDKDPNKKHPSINQIKEKIKKGQAPNSIKRADKGGSPESPEDHIHFDDKSALNRSGTWRHSDKSKAPRNLTGAEKRFLIEAGFNLPEL